MSDNPIEAIRARRKQLAHVYQYAGDLMSPGDKQWRDDIDTLLAELNTLRQQLAEAEAERSQAQTAAQQLAGVLRSEHERFTALTTALSAKIQELRLSTRQ